MPFSRRYPGGPKEISGRSKPHKLKRMPSIAACVCWRTSNYVDSNGIASTVWCRNVVFCNAGHGRKRLRKIVVLTTVTENNGFIRENKIRFFRRTAHGCAQFSLLFGGRCLWLLRIALWRRESEMGVLQFLKNMEAWQRHEDLQLCHYEPRFLWGQEKQDTADKQRFTSATERNVVIPDSVPGWTSWQLGPALISRIVRVRRLATQSAGKPSHFMRSRVGCELGPLHTLIRPRQSCPCRTARARRTLDRSRLRPSRVVRCRRTRRHLSV